MARQIEFRQQLLNRRYFVRLLVDFDVRQHQCRVGGERAEHLPCLDVVEVVEAALESLTIQGNDACPGVCVVPLKVKSLSQKGLKQFRSYEAKKGEGYMSKSQLNHFRGILNEWKAELTQDIDRTVHTMQDELTSHADPNDRASQESDMALELRNRDRERKLIKKIDETFRNIESQDYGYCAGCGEEIGLKRLEARPTATLCIDCKTLDEIREKQMAG